MSRFLRVFFRTAFVSFTLLNVTSAQDGKTKLELQIPIEREMKGGEVHNYAVNLTAGQFLFVTITQKGVNVVETLSGPEGTRILEMDSPNGTRATEQLFYIAETGGEYKIEIKPLQKEAPKGLYEIKINELRAGNPDDKYFVSAKKLMSEGLFFLAKREEESLAKADEKYSEALRLFRLMEDKPRKADLIYEIGKIYPALRRNEKAIPVLLEAESLFEELGLKLKAAMAFFDAGRFSSKINDAQNNYKKALILAREAADKKLEVSSLIEIGNTYYLLGNFPQAIQNYQESIKISEELKYHDKMASALNNIGTVYQTQGNFVRSLNSYQKVLELFTELGQSKEIPPTLLNIGNVFEGQGNHQQALQYYQKALEGFKNSKANVGLAYATSNIGSVYLNSGEYDKALDFFQKAKELKTAFLPKDVESYFNIGLVYAFQDKPQEALEYFQKSLEIAENIKDQNSVAQTLEAMAEEYFSQGDYQKSLEFSGNAIKLAKEFDYPQIYWKALQTSAKTHLALGQNTEARQELILTISIIEDLRKNVAGNEEEQQRFFANKTSPYSLMIDLQISQNNFTEALTYAERSKSRVLLDVLKSGKVNINKAMTPPELLREQGLKDEIISLNARVSKESQNPKPDQNLLLSLNDRLHKKRLEFEDLRAGIYAIHPELKIQRGEMNPITLEDAGTLLPNSNSALIEFVVSENKTYLFVLTKENNQTKTSLRVYRLEIKQKDLSGQTENFRNKLATGDLDFARQSQNLYNLLLKPAEVQLKNKTNLIVVPDGPLWDLPFQALQTASNKFLIETTAVSYTPSLTALREMSRKNKGKQVSPMTLLAFGNPTVGESTSKQIKQVFMSEKLEPLPEAERLVKSLGQMYGAEKSKVLVGAEAREEIAKTESPKYRIVQFATHGILNNISPMYSHLVLSQKIDNPTEDGLLEAWEMKDLNLNADLVILSACETARGKVSGGEGVIGMSWAMFIAGAPTTVASQWKVESASTTELMLEFHRQLLTGKNLTKAEALRKASLKLLKTPNYKHPSYWAGFVMIGDGS